MRKIVWIARDAIRGYTLWCREPYLVKLINNVKIFMNNDNPCELLYVPLQQIDIDVDNFPEIKINECVKLEIENRLFDYYFYD